MLMQDAAYLVCWPRLWLGSHSRSRYLRQGAQYSGNPFSSPQTKCSSTEQGASNHPIASVRISERETVAARLIGFGTWNNSSSARPHPQHKIVVMWGPLPKSVCIMVFHINCKAAAGGSLTTSSRHPQRSNSKVVPTTHATMATACGRLCATSENKVRRSLCTKRPMLACASSIKNNPMKHSIGHTQRQANGGISGRKGIASLTV